MLYALYPPRTREIVAVRLTPLEVGEDSRSLMIVKCESDVKLDLEDDEEEEEEDGSGVEEFDSAESSISRQSS